METPITVSSTSTERNKSDFLQLNYSPIKNDDTIISIDSTSYERVPVSWDAKNVNFARTDSNTTLTNIQKVSNWIKSIEGEESKSGEVQMELTKSSPFSDSIKSDPMESIKKDDVPDTKSVILFRCDFNKSVTAKTYYPPLNPFNRATPLITYFKTEKGTKISGGSLKIPKDINETATRDKLQTTGKRKIKQHLVLKRPNSGKLINYPSQINNKFSIETQNESFNHAKISDEKSEGDSDLYEVPLSPESRKKELCSYLQLMNPADKKERFILQNRRSTRVRNLAAMQEKKELERKIKRSEVEDIEKDTEKCATLKSFKELNIKVDKVNKFGGKEFVEDKIKAIDFEADSFCFPFPSKNLTEQINDFDTIMAKLVPRYKRICKIKNFKLNTNIKLKKSVPKNKENLVRNTVKTKRKEINVARRTKINKAIKVKNSFVSPKVHKLKDILRSRYKKPLTAKRANPLRSPGNLKTITLKKRVKKEKAQVQSERRNLRKKEPQVHKDVDKTKLRISRESPASVTSRPNSKSMSTGSQCEIVTVTEKSDDRVDLENFMDDMIDFNNLSEEHKKCLIESRILSTKPMTKASSTNCVEEDPSKSLHSLQSISPLYGFDKSDVNEVKKICETYKNSLLRNCSSDVLLPDCFLDPNELKVEASENVEDIEYKAQMLTDKTPIEKLASPVIEDVVDQELIDSLDDSRFKIESEEEKQPQPSLNKEDLTNGTSLQEHDYAGMPSEDDEEEKEIDVVTVPNKNLPVGSYIQINPRKIAKPSYYEVLPYNKSVEMKSLHRSLQYLKKKTPNGLMDQTFAREWDADNSPKQKSKKQSHYISINTENGPVLKAFYIDYNLIVCQEYVVSFWMQTPLGNVLGSQNMWIPRGETQRLVLNNKCVQKESMEMVIALETHVAYIELWTKEHKSDIREGPVADVFATVYFWKQRQSGLERKVLQLENINGFADDVQYSVMKCVPKIIVSWHSANEDSVTRRTFIHAYRLAPDYQTVANIYDIEPVDHYVSSLHNIEDCDNLIMGCGENKITLWNVEYGYIVATVELTEIKSPLCTLWVKCDRGFLFALQQCVDRELRLIAINGINHSWKKLASYIPPEGFDRLRGVCIENGLLVSFYDQGILCWKAETGEPVEETNIETEIIPSGKYVILLEGNRILVKHAVTHLMSVSAEDT